MKHCFWRRWQMDETPNNQNKEYAVINIDDDSVIHDKYPEGIVLSGNKKLKFINVIIPSSKSSFDLSNVLINHINLNEVAIINYHVTYTTKIKISHPIKMINKTYPKIKQIATLGGWTSESEFRDGEEFVPPPRALGKSILEKLLADWVEKEIKKERKYEANKEARMAMGRATGWFVIYRDSRPMIKSIRRDIEDLISINICGFITPGFLAELSSPKLPPFANLLLNDAPPKIYIISAPSGYGKSTLVDRLKYFGIRQLPKVVTREPRPGEKSKNNIEFISGEEYKNLLYEGEIIGHAEANKGAYGIRKSVLEKVFKGYRNYVTDRNFEAACKIRAEYPDKVKLVALFPSLSFAGLGLEERISKLDIPTERFTSFIEELEFLKKSRYTIQDTKDRLKLIVKQAKEFEKNIPYCDIVLDKYSVEENEAQLLEKMAE
jgi:guanylate kinase